MADADADADIDENTIRRQSKGRAAESVEVSPRNTKKVKAGNPGDGEA